MENFNSITSQSKYCKLSTIHDSLESISTHFKFNVKYKLGISTNFSEDLFDLYSETNKESELITPNKVYDENYMKKFNTLEIILQSSETSKCIKLSNTDVSYDKNIWKIDLDKFSEEMESNVALNYKEMYDNIKEMLSSTLTVLRAFD